MSTQTQTKLWDFSQVLDLVNSLSSSQQLPEPTQHGATTPAAPLGGTAPVKDLSHTEHKDFAKPRGSGLGDFGRVWQLLGTPTEAAVPATPSAAAQQSNSHTFTSKDDYASDGATYFKLSTKRVKTVQWEKASSPEDLPNDTVTDRSASPDTPTLTKSQRKKQNRKLRKAKEAEVAAAKAAKASARTATVSESEADSKPRRAPTPARKASAHLVAAESAKQHDSRKLKENETPDKPVSFEASIDLARTLVAKKLSELQTETTLATKAQRAVDSIESGLKHSSTTKQNLTSHLPNTPASDTVVDGASKSRPAQERPSVSPYISSVTKFLPSTVQPQHHSAAFHSVAQPAQPATPNPSLRPARAKHAIEPKIVRSGEDKDWALLMKLIADFWQDRKHLIAPMNLTTHNNHPNGIHVFVDASNIFIGFTEQLKRSRGIPWGAQVPQVDLSFDALALLMERRRPVAKRVLVGSTPHLPAFDTAKAVGYECSILEKVYKARELTERQLYFQEHDWRRFSQKKAKAPPANNVLLKGSTADGNALDGTPGGSGSGSETSAPQFAKARMIEQGVDEILHLKILESIVDAETPSTIVLATGDAAQAEYSEGFMAMAERALKKGWTVELVSWSKNISMMYQRKEWVQKWGEKFKVIFLDDYAEELLDM